MMRTSEIRRGWKARGGGGFQTGRVSCSVRGQQNEDHQQGRE